MKEAEKTKEKRKFCPLLMVIIGSPKTERARCLGPACAWWRELSPMTQAQTGKSGYCAICNI